jgi:aminoglycoside N3'-acetyltransferase
MGKRPNLNLDDYIEETTTNIREDRAMAKSLLMDAISDMKVSDAARKDLGSIAAKYVENLQRSNEQLVRLTALLQKEKEQHLGLTADDKEQIFDLLNTPEEE